LRPDTVDPTLLRTKLVSDIHNRLGIPSLSANYITLYINNEYIGLYVLTDLFKLSWVEFEYGEKDTTSLYKCEHSYLTSGVDNCKNENDDIQGDIMEWNEFIETLDNANSASDIEDIFDIDQFLTEMAIEFLTGGWDHYQNDHNYIIFKPKNGKWLYLSHDFDLDISGRNMHPVYTIEEFIKNSHLMDILIYKILHVLIKFFKM
ncbi:coth-domain-containing protein, partial [Anaeromyces robustus]